MENKPLTSEDLEKVLSKYAQFQEPEDSDMPLDEFVWQVWLPGLERMCRTEATRREYACIYKRHIQPRFGDTPLCDIRERDVREWVWDLPPNRVSKVFRVFRACLRYAYNYEYLSKKPLTRHIDKPVVRAETKQLWTAAQAIDVAHRLEGWRFELVALLMLGGGLRREEAVALRADNVEVIKSRGWLRVHICEAYTPVDGLKELKTTTSYRTVIIGRPFAARIVDRFTEFRSGVEDGRQVDPDYMTRQWRKLYEEGGRLEGIEPAIPFAQLRHVHETLMLASGSGGEVVSRLHGHSEKVEYDWYFGTSDELVMEATETLTTYLHERRERVDS